MIFKRLIFLTILFCIFNLILIFLKFDEINFVEEKFLQLQTCPFCYGTSFCNQLYQKIIKLENQNSLSGTFFFQSLLNIKNVFFVVDSFTDQKYVFKKLAHSNELDQFDLNEKQRIESIPKSILAKKLDADLFKQISNYLQIEIGTCLSQRLLDLMYLSFIKFNNLSEKKLELINLMLLTTLKINPEPLILQVV